MPVIVGLVLLGASFPVYCVVGRLLFGGTDGFAEAIDRWKQWDWEVVDGDYVGKMWAEARLTLMLFICIALLFAEYKLVMYGLNVAFGI